LNKFESSAFFKDYGYKINFQQESWTVTMFSLIKYLFVDNF